MMVVLNFVSCDKSYHFLLSAIVIISKSIIYKHNNNHSRRCFTCINTN